MSKSKPQPKKPKFRPATVSPVLVLQVILCVLGVWRSGMPLARALLTLTASLTLALGVLVGSTGPGRMLLRRIADAFDELLKPPLRRFLYPEMQPRELILWLTKGRIDPETSCKRKAARGSFYPKRPCNRKSCWFPLVKHDVPILLKPYLPRRGKHPVEVTLRPFRSEHAADQPSQGGVTAFVLGWCSGGLAVEVAADNWDEAQGWCRSSELVFSMCVPRYRIQQHVVGIVAKERRTEGQTVTLHAQFYDPLLSIVPDRKIWLSLPVGLALEAEGRADPHQFLHRLAAR